MCGEKGLVWNVCVCVEVCTCLLKWEGGKKKVGWGEAGWGKRVERKAVVSGLGCLTLSLGNRRRRLHAIRLLLSRVQY